MGLSSVINQFVPLVGVFWESLLEGPRGDKGEEWGEYACRCT